MVVRGGVVEYDHTRSFRRHTSAPTVIIQNGNEAASLTHFGVGIASPGIHIASSTTPGERRYKLTKVGVLNRKDDLADGGVRVPNRGQLPGTKWVQSKASTLTHRVRLSISVLLQVQVEPHQQPSYTAHSRLISFQVTICRCRTGIRRPEGKTSGLSNAMPQPPVKDGATSSQFSL